jgi:hypothetical protein
MNELADPRAACALLMALAQIALMASGFALMFSCRMAAARLFLVVVFLVVTAVIVPGALAR